MPGGAGDGGGCRTAVCGGDDAAGGSALPQPARIDAIAIATQISSLHLIGPSVNGSR